MATITSITVVPHTRIANEIILNMAEIGVYAYAVYSAIKMHVNQRTGKCIPSYATIARMTGIHRSTVIVCVKKLRARQLVDPHWRFKEDGSHATNQYDFQPPEKPGTSQEVEKSGQTDKGSRPERPLVVGEDDHPGCPQRPEQDVLNKKKERTSETLAALPTDKQKTCPHPPSEIASLPAENIRICHHCWGLLDERLTLVTTSVPPSPQSALPECEASAEPKAMQPPVGNTVAQTTTETPVKMARTGHQIAVDARKRGRVPLSLALLGKVILGALKAS